MTEDINDCVNNALTSVSTGRLHCPKSDEKNDIN